MQRNAGKKVWHILEWCPEDYHLLLIFRRLLVIIDEIPIDDSFDHPKFPEAKAQLVFIQDERGNMAIDPIMSWAVAQLFITRRSVQKNSLKKKCVQSSGHLRRWPECHVVSFVHDSLYE